MFTKRWVLFEKGFSVEVTLRLRALSKSAILTRAFSYFDLLFWSSTYFLNLKSPYCWLEVTKDVASSFSGFRVSAF